jgi:lipoate synthase
MSFGFKAVESGIFTRSSYGAGALLDKILKEKIESVIS